MDILRAAAAVGVAGSHIRNILMADYAGQGGIGRIFYFITGFGHAGVIVFFVLSGFWITKTVLRRADESGFWRLYLVDRMSRLWVVLLPALVLGGILDLVGSRIVGAPLYDGTSGAESLAHAITLAPSVFVANALFVQSLIAPTFGSNGPLWSLAYEFWFYLWFPAIWLTVRRRRPSIALLTLVMGFFYPALAFGFISWLCGSTLFAATRRWGAITSSRQFAVPALIVSLTGFAATLVAIRVYPRGWMDPLLAGSFSLLLFAVHAANLRPVGFGIPARFGAKASFSLYAIHYPVAALASALLAPDGRMAYSPYAVMLVAAILLLSIGAAIAFAALTEAHTPLIRRKFGYASALAT